MDIILSIAGSYVEPETALDLHQLFGTRVIAEAVDLSEQKSPEQYFSAYVLKTITRLNLSETKLSADSVSQLHLMSLRHLDLTDADFTDAMCLQITSLKLESLDLSGTLITSTGLELLIPVSETLSKLTLNDERSDEPFNLGPLSKFHHLTWLNLTFQNPVNLDHMEFLRHMRLRWLNIDLADVPPPVDMTALLDHPLVHLRLFLDFFPVTAVLAIPSLREVILSSLFDVDPILLPLLARMDLAEFASESLHDADLALLANSTMRTLKIHDQVFTGELARYLPVTLTSLKCTVQGSLKEFTRLTALTHLNLGNSTFDPNELGFLRDLPLLKLSLWNCRLDSLKELTNRHLITLGLSNNPVRHQLQYLAGMTNLTELNVSATNVVNTDIEAIAHLPLARLDLYETHVGNGCIPYLARMPLKDVFVSQTRITDFLLLASRLPRTKIYSERVSSTIGFFL